MRIRSVAVFVGAGLLVLAAAVAVATAQGRTGTGAELHQGLEATVGPPRALTLSEARGVLKAYAESWSAGADVASLCSIDEPKADTSAGRDGRRRAWLALLTSTRDGRGLRVRLVDGAVAERGEEPAAPGTPALSGDLGIDSPEALQRALLARPAFAAAGAKASGFHFGLQSLPTGSLAIAVHGAYSGKAAVITLDGTTGAVLAAEFETYEFGGILCSVDAGRTWQASNLVGVQVNGLAADPWRTEWGYAVAATGSAIATYQTHDGGRTWSEISVLPPAAGDWPYASSLATVPGPRETTVLLVGTASGLWQAAVGGEWSRVGGLPEGPPQWTSVAQAGERWRLFVSITAGAHRGLYVTTDLSNWEKLDGQARRLSVSYDRRMVLATDEESPKALLLDVDGGVEAPLPRSVLRAAGDMAGPAGMVLGSADGAGRWQHATQSWTLQRPVASLAASPDFTATGVAIAGGFRSGVYRTEDAGQTWQLVVAQPSAIVAGNDEMGVTAFLSPTCVVAANGGQKLWREF